MSEVLSGFPSPHPLIHSPLYSILLCAQVGFLLQTASPGHPCSVLPMSLGSRMAPSQDCMLGRRGANQVFTPLFSSCLTAVWQWLNWLWKRACALFHFSNFPGSNNATPSLWPFRLRGGDSFCCCLSPNTSTSLDGSFNPVSSLNSLCLNSLMHHLSTSCTLIGSMPSPKEHPD